MNLSTRRKIFALALSMAVPAIALGALRLDRQAAPVAAQGGLSEAWRLAATWDGARGQSAPGAVLYPAGIDVGGDRLYLVDQGNDRVQRFTMAKAVDGTWGDTGTALGQLDQPQDIAVDGDRFYVTDRGNGRVVVYDLTGQALAEWRAAGLTEPWGIAARAGRAWVSQPGTGEVFVLENGSLVGKWSGLLRPRGLALGADGRVYVADEGASAVRFFSPEGADVGRLETNLAPLDVAVDERADLYVMSSGAVLWYQAGKRDSTQALYRRDLRGVAVSSRHGVFGTVARDGRDAKDLTFHGVVRWPWRPQNVDADDWPQLGYPLGRLHRPHAIATGGDGHLWVLDGWPRTQAFNLDGSVAHQHAPAGLAVAADVAVTTAGEVVLGEARRLVRLAPNGAISATVGLNQGTTRYWLTALAMRPGDRRVAVLDSALLQVRDYGITRTTAPAGAWPLATPDRWRLYWDLALPTPNPANRTVLVNRGEQRIEVYEDQTQVATWPTDGTPIRAAAGPDGTVFVLTADGIVTKLGPAGQAVAAWDAAAFSVDEADVVDLTVGPDGRVYTVDRAANVVRVWERDPAGVPEPPQVQRGACRLRVDKRAAPQAVLLGDEVTVSLAVGGDCPSSAPQADILLVIDRSGSMLQSNKITDTRKAAKAFIDAIDLTRDRVGVVAFNNGGELMQALTGDGAAAKAAIDRIDAVGGTSIANALDVATAELFGPRARPATQPVLVLLTDGIDREPETALRAALAVQARGARVFTIGFGDVDPMIMVLAASSPEEYFFAPDTATLTDIYTTIARRITAMVLARTMTIADDLPADMTYLGMITGPTPTVQGQRLTWQLTDVPFAGVTLAYRVRPTIEGRRPTNVQAEAQFVDGLDRAGKARFPVPVVDVLVHTPTPRPTNTPVPTITPVPTATLTPRPVEPVYLPIAVKQACEDRTIYADVAIVLDTSGSMNEQSYPGGATKLDAARAAATLFVGKLALPDDHATVIAFNSDVRLLQPLTGNQALLLAALGTLSTQSGTRIDLGLDTARAELTGPGSALGRTRVIVLLTDGQPTGVEPEQVVDAARTAQAAGLKVFAIGLGADVDGGLLAALASEPSYLYLAPSTDDLSRIYAAIAITIRCANLTWPPGRPTPAP